MKSHELAKYLLELEDAVIVAKEKGDAFVVISNLEQLDGIRFDNYPNMYYKKDAYCEEKPIVRLILLK